MNRPPRLLSTLLSSCLLLMCGDTTPTDSAEAVHAVMREFSAVDEAGDYLSAKSHCAQGIVDAWGTQIESMADNTVEQLILIADGEHGKIEFHVNGDTVKLWWPRTLTMSHPGGKHMEFSDPIEKFLHSFVKFDGAWKLGGEWKLPEDPPDQHDTLNLDHQI